MIFRRESCPWRENCLSGGKKNCEVDGEAALAFSLEDLTKLALVIVQCIAKPFYCIGSSCENTDTLNHHPAVSSFNHYREQKLDQCDSERRHEYIAVFLQPARKVIKITAVK